MRKLKLDLEALDVRSFATEARLVSADGTVHARDETVETEWCNTTMHPCTRGHACQTQNCPTYTCTVAPNC